jgi:hypothetical protein
MVLGPFANIKYRRSHVAIVVAMDGHGVGIVQKGAPAEHRKIEHALDGSREWREASAF